jgi:hypothetical protein
LRRKSRSSAHIARGRAGFEAQDSDGAVSAKEARFKARPLAALENAHRCDQRPQNILYRREIEKRLGEAPLDHAAAGRRRDRASCNRMRVSRRMVSAPKRPRAAEEISEIAQSRRAGARRSLSWPSAKRGDGQEFSSRRGRDAFRAKRGRARRQRSATAAQP